MNPLRPTHRIWLDQPSTWCRWDGEVIVRAALAWFDRWRDRRGNPFRNFRQSWSRR